MRRVTLGIFFCLAACGGTDMVKQSPRVDARADRQAFLLGRAAHDVIATFTGKASTEAIDTCLNAWVEEVGPASPRRARSPSRTWPASAGSLPSASPRARRMPAPAATGRRPASARAATGSSLNPSRCQ